MSTNKFLLTEKSVDRVFKSGLRLSVKTANEHPHKETTLLQVPESQNKNFLKKVNQIESLNERSAQENKKITQNFNRYKLDNNTIKAKTNVYFNDFDSKPFISSQISTSLKGKNENSNRFQNQESIIEEKLLKPSQSQIIKIKQLTGSNAVNLLNKKEIDKYNKQNIVSQNRQVASYQINQSKGMFNILNEKNKSNKSTIREAEKLNSKVNNFPSSVITTSEAFTEKKKTVKTFRHLFSNGKIGGFMY